MIVYFDTSALIKRYLAEADSDVIAELWANADRMASSQLLYAEMSATFARKRREQPAHSRLIDEAHRTFVADWITLERIPIDDEVNGRVDGLMTHPLRGADAVHLASALRLRELAQDEVTFACADVALKAAAHAEGLIVSP